MVGGTDCGLLAQSQKIAWSKKVAATFTFFLGWMITLAQVFYIYQML